MTTGLVLVQGVEGSCSPPPPDCLNVSATLDDLPPAGTLVGADFETRGTNAADPSFGVVGLGLAWRTLDDTYTACYLDLTGPVDMGALLDRLASYDLVAHNVLFDAAALERIVRDNSRPTFWSWAWCTYGLYRQFATEGHKGQRWGLKQAMVQLLGWPESNEHTIHEWLVCNKYVKRVKNPEKFTTEQLMEKYNKFDSKGVRLCSPDLEQMWRVPADILGPYCCLDAVAALQLHDLIFRPLLDRFPQVVEYHQHEFLGENRILVKQLFDGILIDIDKFSAYDESLIYCMQQTEARFKSHPHVNKYINQHNINVVDKHRSKEPNKLRKDNCINKNWIKWNNKLALLSSTDHFNLASDKQLRWLFYDCLGNPVKLLTDSGLPAVNTKSFGLFGPSGLILREYSEYDKEHGYATKILESKDEHNQIHLQFRNPGTLTSRLAGSGGINGQQIPGNKGYMQCWIPRPGRVWLHMDFDSLEQVVLAELSRDATLWKLYGPEANPNHDVYLFNGAHIPGLADNILKYYDPENPTRESKTQAKEACKRERAIAKKLTLSASYGAGVAKIREDLQLQGVDITWDEVKQAHISYWELYSGVVEFGQRLEKEWTDRGGWIYNGLAIPLTVAPNKTKDLVNRTCQSTGHMILMKFLQYLETRLNKLGYPYWWIIADLHDETIIEIEESHALEVKHEFEQAFTDLNTELGGDIPITGDVDISSNLWNAKKGINIRGIS